MSALLSIAEWIVIAFAIVGMGMLAAAGHMTPDAADFRGTTPSMEVRAAIWRAMGLAGLVQVLVIVIIAELGRGPRTGLGIWALLAVVGVFGWYTARQMLAAVGRNIRHHPLRIAITMVAFIPLAVLCATSPDATTGDRTWTATAVLGVVTILVGADVALRVTSKARHSRRSASGYLLMATVVAATIAMAALRWLFLEEWTYIVVATVLVLVAVAYLIERQSADAGRYSLLGATLATTAVACLITWWALPAFVIALAIAFAPVVTHRKHRMQELSLAMDYAGVPLAMVALAATFASIGRL